MAKNKYKKNFEKKSLNASSPSISPLPSQPVEADMANDSQSVRHDMIQTVIVNVLFVALLFGTYFLNRQGQYLETWIGHVLKF